MVKWNSTFNIFQNVSKLWYEPLSFLRSSRQLGESFEEAEKRELRARKAGDIGVPNTLKVFIQ